MIGFDSVISERGFGGNWVLSHEIASQSIAKFMVLLVRPVLSLPEILVSLFLSLLKRAKVPLVFLRVVGFPPASLSASPCVADHVPPESASKDR